MVCTRVLRTSLAVLATVSDVVRAASLLNIPGNAGRGASSQFQSRNADCVAGDLVAHLDLQIALFARCLQRGDRLPILGGIEREPIWFFFASPPEVVEHFEALCNGQWATVGIY